MRNVLLALLVAVALAPANAHVLDRDPPVDLAHPAGGNGIQFISKGERVNGQLYWPSGAGLKRAVILLHGLPGNEQGLDLARAMQRDGWVVVTFHYRGSWGSGGSFTLDNGCDDVDALIADIRAPGGAAKWGIDPARMVIMGHSMGGYVAACAAQRHPEVRGVGLLAPWDISVSAREFAAVAPADYSTAALQLFDDVDGRLTGADARSLFDTVRTRGASMALASFAPALANRSLLIATATRDGDDNQALALRPALAAAHAGGLTFRQFTTDHSFNDQRIALTRYVIGWLDRVGVRR